MKCQRVVSYSQRPPDTHYYYGRDGIGFLTTFLNILKKKQLTFLNTFIFDSTVR